MGFAHLHSRRLPALTLALVLALSSTMVAFANVALNTLSTDPFTNTSSQHRTEVEPDSFAFGSTIVAATQTGRFTDGGSSDIGWATSTNGGLSWTHGFLPGVTIYQGGGTYQRVSDPSVAYDPKDNVWLISSLAIGSGSTTAVLVNRSTDGGLTWSNPVTVTPHSGLDKDWIACDTTASSPFYGHCYTEWDDNGAGNVIKMSTSSDGGLSWGPALNTANTGHGLGGQPLVQPNGTVVVPISNGFNAILAFTSTNGGASWSITVTVAQVQAHTPAAGIRSDFLPSAEIDGAGKVFVAWQDCRFRTSCSSNDIVYSTSTDGTNWSAVTRVPIDSTTSGVDHFIPGIGVDRTTAGASAHLGLAYYYYPVAQCTVSTCQLDVGFISSTNGGASWSTATQLAGPMKINWLASTTGGRMVGDYISTSFIGTKAYPVFAVAKAKSGTTFNEALTTVISGLAVRGGSAVATGAGAASLPATTAEPRVPRTAQ
ncbi:MAG: exo-alpha-sialidase [Herpetosiphonaceae bacterium]|nr:exo-alpha-sialidase [Herpetosiphonaceae bacterium]